MESLEFSMGPAESLSLTTEVNLANYESMGTERDNEDDEDELLRSIHDEMDNRVPFMMRSPSESSDWNDSLNISVKSHAHTHRTGSTLWNSGKVDPGSLIKTKFLGIVL